MEKKGFRVIAGNTKVMIYGTSRVQANTHGLSVIQE